MTTKETALALNVSERVVQKHASLLGLTANGKQTELDEKAVTIIKAKIERSGRTDLAQVCELPNVSTDLEMMALDAKVSAWKTRKIEELQQRLNEAERRFEIDAPKVESFNAIQRSENTMSITQAAKHFGLHPKTEVFPYLRDCGYLTGSDLPSQAALDAGYLVQRQTRCPDGVFRPAACVMLSQLETWRVRVVPQIEAWKERSK